jgi:2-methylcitrate dehydratase PrpD
MAEPGSLTEQLAAFVVAVEPTDLPPAVVDAAKYFLLDWLGSAMAGTNTPTGQMFLEHAAEQGPGPSTVIGLDGQWNAQAAALANGALSHIVEMDDLHRASIVHPGAAVIPAALAVAEWQRTSGLGFLSATVLGYEVAIRVGEAVGKSHYRFWHNTATCGVFGAAAAAGRLLNLQVEQMVWALGNAGTMAAGLWEFNADGAMSKPLHAGRAAASGLLAADLARRGVTGARRILEGERGFFAATSQDADPERVVAGLSPTMAGYKISGVSIKPHAACRHTHPAIDAALRIRAQIGSAAGQIDGVEVETYQAALALTDNPAPTQTHAAKFSMQYCVASALLRGSVGLGDFKAGAIADPRVWALMERVRLRQSPVMEARYPAAWPVRVSVTLRDGRTLTESVDHPRGDPENPLSWDELEAKFGQMLVGTPWEARVEALIEWVHSLDQARTVQLL